MLDIHYTISFVFEIYGKRDVTKSYGRSLAGILAIFCEVKAGNRVWGVRQFDEYSRADLIGNARRTRCSA